MRGEFKTIPKWLKPANFAGFFVQVCWVLLMYRASSSSKVKNKGIETPTGVKGVWLDTPLIEMIHGEGTIEKRLPAMLRMYKKFDIDMRTEPILVYPTLHYQNGGLLIDEHGQTKAENLYVAGECAGGIHGRNRLMGNSLLDILVFGRRAGAHAGAKSQDVEVKELSLEHVKGYHNSLEKNGVKTDRVSPMLLPHYTHGREDGE